MSIVRTALFRLIGVALLVALAAGVVWYTVVVPRQREQRFHAAPDPRPTATDATATSVTPAPTPVSGTDDDGVVHDFVVKVGACYETHPPAAGGADVTPQARSCDGPHNTVAVGSHTLSDPAGVPFSATDVPREAQAACDADQDGLIHDRPGFQPVTIYPGADAWATGDRTAGCLVRRDGPDVSGSFEE